MPANKHNDRASHLEQGASRSHAQADSLSKVAGALEAGQPEEAVRRFMEVVARRGAANGADFNHWIAGKLGRSGAEALIDAFAHHPCFFCRGGRQRCHGCDGEGVFERGYVCDSCVGTGASRCDFCDGTGWVTIDYVPQPLRASVMMRRAALARARLKALVQQPVPRPAESDPQGAMKTCMKLLFNLDRQMGVFENTLTGGDLLGPLGEAAGGKLRQVAAAGVQYAVAGRRRMAEVLEVMARAAAMTAAALGLDSPKHKFALRRSRYYESLSKTPSWTDTGLHHPFLEQAMARRQGDGPAASAKTAASAPAAGAARNTGSGERQAGDIAGSSPPLGALRRSA